MILGDHWFISLCRLEPITLRRLNGPFAFCGRIGPLDLTLGEMISGDHLQCRRSSQVSAKWMCFLLLHSQLCQNVQLLKTIILDFTPFESQESGSVLIGWFRFQVSLEVALRRVEGLIGPESLLSNSLASTPVCCHMALSRLCTVCQLDSPRVNALIQTVSSITWSWKWHAISSTTVYWSYRPTLSNVWTPAGGDHWGPSWKLIARVHTM